MVFKHKRSSTSTTSLHLPSLSLQCFPPELLLITFQNLDIPTLLNLCNVCKLFQQIGTDVLSKKFQDPSIGLMLTFLQEHKYKFNVPFEFCEINEINGNFVFKPTEPEKLALRFVHSSVVKNPVLSKVSMTGINGPSDDHVGKIREKNQNVNTNHHHLATLLPSTTTSTTTTIKPKKLEENYLQNSLALNIKPHKKNLKKIRHVYRMGHGTTHLRIPYVFTYSISDVPPPTTPRTRDGGGERWLTPTTFECAPGFFYPREPITRQIIMSIIQLRKRNLTKKKPSNLPSTNYLSKQKQQSIKINIHIEEVDDFNVVTTNVIMNDQENQENFNPTISKRLFENRMNHQEYLSHLLSSTKKSKGSKRCVRGARS